jgi:hypothetical protein
MENLIIAVSLAFLAAVATFVVVVHRRQCRTNRRVVERLVSQHRSTLVDTQDRSLVA